MTHKTKIGIVGCGNIAGRYLDCLRKVEEIEVAAVVDLDSDKARAFAGEHQIPWLADLDALLADTSITVVANLTIHFAHFEVSKALLNGGKHVFSEKPLTMDPEEAMELVHLAESKKLRLSCAPITYLGEAPKTLARKIASGSLGKIRLVYAEVNHDRIESWHPNPAPFYEVGPVWDVGPYPLAMATAILGPVARVNAYGRILHPQRQDQNGKPFDVKSPDYTTALLEFESGAVMRLTMNFYVGDRTPSFRNLEFHGDDGSALIESWCDFSAPMKIAELGKPLERLPNDFPDPYPGVDWSRGLEDLVTALREKRPHLAQARHAAHLVEVLGAIRRSVHEDGAQQEIQTRFESLPFWE